MVGVLSFPNTTIGKKVIMAITGAIWIGFVAGHMFGNLKIFTGAEHFNEYAHGLRTFGEPILGYGQFLFLARIVIIFAIGSHVWAAVTLWSRNQQARSVSYTQHRKMSSSAATQTMIWGGVTILLFIIFHLLHFTLGTPGIHPNFEYGNAYQNVVIGFQSYFYLPVVLYMIALVALAFHLYHGTWSMFQTVGLNNRTYDQGLHILAWAVAIIIPLGFATVPMGVVFGLLTL
jgi:succinate dehydrogenase / fumarate reductase cytochrome b subunit